MSRDDRYSGYDEYDTYDASEEIRRRKARARKRAEARKRKKRIFYIKAVLRLLVYILVLAAIVTGVVLGIKKIISVFTNDKKELDDESKIVAEELIEHVPSEAIEVEVPEQETETETYVEENKIYSANASDKTINGFPEGVASTYGVFININSGEIIRQLDGKTRMFPASMTKVLTALVACEHLTEADLDNTFTMTPEINYYAYKNDCSTVGFLDEEVVTVRDLLYGTILPSGGDAAVGLATYIAGDQESFVEMMNEKLQVLGLSDTSHFTNCVGLFDENHYTTCYDMAMMMEAAIDNPMCRDVLHAHKYTTSSTSQHPNGIEISNWFLRRIEDHISGGEVYCAKTGFVNESGNCAVSYCVSADGSEYVCATGNSTGGWKCIKDHVKIYQTVLDGNGNESSLDSMPDEGDISE